MSEDGNCSRLELESCATTAENNAYLYVYSPVCLLGIIFNVLNLIILCRRSLKLHPSTCSLLVGLAWFDLLCLVLAAPLGFVRCLPYAYTWEKMLRNVYETYIFLPLVNTLATGSVWLTVVISVERFLFVKHWLLARRLCAPNSTPKIILAITLISALGINMPYFFYQTLDENGNIVKTDFGEGFGFYCYMWIRLTFVKFLPIILATAFNILLLVTVRSVQAQVGQMVVMATRQSVAMTTRRSIDDQGRRHGQQLRLVSLVVAISVVFVLCNVLEPFTHSRIYAGMFGECSLNSEAYRILRVVSNILEMFSFAINFVLFCMFSRQFRLACSRLLCCCIQENRVDHFGAVAVPDFSEKPNAERPVQIMEYSESHKAQLSRISEHDAESCSVGDTLATLELPSKKLDT